MHVKFAQRLFGSIGQDSLTKLGVFVGRAISGFEKRDRFVFPIDKKSNTLFYLDSYWVDSLNSLSNPHFAKPLLHDSFRPPIFRVAINELGRVIYLLANQSNISETGSVLSTIQYDLAKDEENEDLIVGLQALRDINDSFPDSSFPVFSHTPDPKFFYILDFLALTLLKLAEQHTNYISADELAMLFRCFSITKYDRAIFFEAIMTLIIGRVQQCLSTAQAVSSTYFAYSRVVYSGIVKLENKHLDILLSLMSLNSYAFEVPQIIDVFEGYELVPLKENEKIRTALKALSVRLLDLQSVSEKENFKGREVFRLTQLDLLKIVYCLAKSKTYIKEFFDFVDKYFRERATLKGSAIRDLSSNQTENSISQVVPFMEIPNDKIINFIYAFAKFRFNYATLFQMICFRIRWTKNSFSISDLAKILLCYLRMSVVVKSLVDYCSKKVKNASLDVFNEVPARDICHLCIVFSSNCIRDAVLFKRLAIVLCRSRFFDGKASSHLSSLENTELLNIFISWSKVYFVDRILFLRISDLLCDRIHKFSTAVVPAMIVKYFAASAKLEFRDPRLQHTLIDSIVPSLSCIENYQIMNLQQSLQVLKLSSPSVEEEIRKRFPENNTIPHTIEPWGGLNNYSRHRQRPRTRTRKYTW